MMNINCVTVCVDCDDHLSMCVDNISQLDTWLIVTNERDKKTIELCKKNNINYITTNCMYQNDCMFAKGKAINHGLKQILHPNCWLLQLDCDIKLPWDFKKDISTYNLDSTKIYGCHRYNLNGTQIVEFSDEGFEVKEPAGYFQLWYSGYIDRYPDTSSTAKQDDSDHVRRFTGWEFLDIKVNHVSDELKINHYGRGPTGRARHKLYN